MVRFGRFVVASLAAAAAFGGSGVSRADGAGGAADHDNQSFDYEFGRPITPGEHTYAWYRQTHAEAAAKTYGLKAADVADGMDTWHWWVGVDNPGFWRDLSTLDGGKHNYTGLHIDFLRILTTVPRAKRFELFGLVNDPDCVAAEKPDQFGLTLDRMKDGTLTWDPDVFGYESGIIGIQLFKNPKFDPKKWSLKTYLASPSAVEPPYNVGMSCAFCHVGFDPRHPPQNPAEPTWENLSSVIGNQYLREGGIFGHGMNDHSLASQYLDIQEPGTSETSRFPSDFINNPTIINSIYRLGDRLKERTPERITPAQKILIESMYKNAGIPTDSPVGSLGGTAAEPTISVPHVLADGSDSMGVLMASVRVYVNEGMMHSAWYSSWPVNPWDLKDSIKRNYTPKEFDIIGTMRKDPNSPWMQTERRMPNMATFLETYDSYPLAEAEGGAVYLSKDEALLRDGKLAFADHCATCHSSKKPEPLPTEPAAAKQAWRDLVLRSDFLDHNYLSDDQRHSLRELGTNAQRAEGTNAQSGSTWGQMSSQTYKDLRAKQETLIAFDDQGQKRPGLYNPLTGAYDVQWTGPAGFYRTPPLVSVWATAPYFHNNSLGLYNGDPSVKGRMAAYDDAAHKLLWPETRLGVKSIKVTTKPTSLAALFPGVKSAMKVFDDLDLDLLALPAGTPINLVMNQNPKNLRPLLDAYVEGVLHGKPRSQLKGLLAKRHDAGMQAFMAKLMALNTCPDFIEDRGHLYGHEMSDHDKNALIEYMKYL